MLRTGHIVHDNVHVRPLRPRPYHDPHSLAKVSLYGERPVFGLVWFSSGVEGSDWECSSGSTRPSYGTEALQTVPLRTVTGVTAEFLLRSLGRVPDRVPVRHGTGRTPGA